MSEFRDWVQGNWLALGILLVQCATLAIVLWYGGKLLRFLRAFFEYQDEFRRRILASVATGEENGGRIGPTWQEVTRWLQAPIRIGGAGPFRRVIKWLQEPMGS